MIDRYTFPEMAAIWGREERFLAWYKVELAWLETLEKRNYVPRGTTDACRGAKMDLGRLDELEAVNRHEVIAFLEMVREQLGEEGRWLHHGLTSSDVMDTGLALQLSNAMDLIFLEHRKYLTALLELGERYIGLLGAGRTHGIFAEPVSFGLRFVRFAATATRDAQRLWDARQGIVVGKLAGTVGSYAAFDSRYEEACLKRLNLTNEPAPSQVVARDRHAHFLQAIALCGSGIETFATEIRHLQRTEVREAEEPFTEGQKGSSAMPHKRNPIVCERLCGLSRLLRGFAQTGLENVALWHERDISHSSTERLTMPTATATLHYMLVRATRVAKHLQVNPLRISFNLERHGADPLSHRLLLLLIEKKKLSREEAYSIVQKISFRMRPRISPTNQRLVAVFAVHLSRLIKKGAPSEQHPKWGMRKVARTLAQELHSDVKPTPSERQHILRAFQRQLMPLQQIKAAWEEAKQEISEAPRYRFSGQQRKSLLSHDYFKTLKEFLSEDDLTELLNPRYYLGEAQQIYDKVHGLAKNLPYSQRIQ